MGFLKKLRRGISKGVVGAVRLAASSGVAGPVGSIIGSKLKSIGAKRAQLANANQVLDAKRAEFETRRLPLSVTGAGKAKTAPPPRPVPAKVIQLKGNAASVLLNTGEVGRRRAVNARLESLAKVDERIKKLTPSQRADLADRFKAEGGGSPAKFRDFLRANL
jgi:hypothetical protein